MQIAAFDIKKRAREAMFEYGFHPDLSAEVVQEAHTLHPGTDTTSNTRDMRELLWSSIDNESSRDLDQVEYVEERAGGSLRLFVGIANVDCIVRRGTATDIRAAVECTSVYTGVTTFPMLPYELSTDRTSLVSDQERLSLVIELGIDEAGGSICHDVYPALIKNKAKLAYNSTGAWLEGRGTIPTAITNVPGMEGQIRLQRTVSDKLRGIRERQGALTFGSVEATPVMENGEVKNLVVLRHNVAEDIIESFMVAANIAMAKFLREKGVISLRRVVRTPKRWERIMTLAKSLGFDLPNTPDSRALADFLEKRRIASPEHFQDLSLSVVKLLGPGEYIVEPPGAEHEGHFGLAANDYTHSTAPNRRYADLVTQRLLKAASSGQPCPYTEAELREIAVHCTEREDAARKVERFMRKVIAAHLLKDRIGQKFESVVTGASPKGTYARLLEFPGEGRIVRGFQGLDVGDKVRLNLLSADPNKGWIDLEVA